MKSLTMLLCSCVIAAALQGQVIYVHPDSLHNTIQSGINDAETGDTVLVSNGIYYEQINFQGKAITVASEFLITGDPVDIDSTIIDGSQIPDGDSCSIVYFINDEDTTSVLCGFTIQHGRGTHVVDTYTIWSGGGIFMSNAGAKLEYNHITENHLSDTTMGVNTQLAQGAGIVECGNDQVDHWLIIDHNIIDQNSLHSEHLQALGAGLWIDNTNAIISNNLISGNTCTATNNSSAVAAGFGLHLLNDETMIARVQSNVFKNNVSLGEELAWASTACGTCQNITCILTGNLIEENTTLADNNIGSKGGVIAIYDPLPGTTVQNNTFQNNITDADGGGFTLWEHQSTPDQETVTVENNYFFNNEALHGGAIYIFNISVLLRNNTFGGNNAELNGGAAYFKKEQPSNNPHLATLINNTFSGNVAGDYGGAIYSVFGDPLIINSIFWNDNSDELGDEIFLQVYDTAEIAYSDIDTTKIEGNGTWYDGGGNIPDDPLFKDPDSLTILPESPCLDAGINVFTCACGVINYCPSYDINGIGRPQSGGFEMGAYELIFTDIPVQEDHWFEAAIYPNPFSNNTTINYTLGKSTRVAMTILNGFGEMVAMPVNGWQQAGEHRVVFNGEGLPAGLYFYRIEAGNQKMSGKMVLTKP